MVNLVDKLSIDLKRNLKNPYNIGDQVLKDLKTQAAIIDRREFSDISFEKYKIKLEEAVNRGIKRFSGDFYIEVHFVRNKMFRKGFSIIAKERLTPSAPLPDRDLIYYYRKSSSMKVLWSIPEKILCKNINLIPLGTSNSEEVRNSIRNFNNGTYRLLYEKLIEKEEI